MRILYADALPSRLLSDTLRAQGYQVDVAESRYETLCYAHSCAYVCILLGGTQARAFLSELRRKECTSPILLLTISDTPAERIAALDAGADDCLSFPFSMDELLARIRALLRRPGEWKEEYLRLGQLVLDPCQAVLRCGGQEQILSQKECLLLETLMRYPGRIFSAGSLIEMVWGSEKDTELNTLWAHLSGLRRKIKKLDADVCIQNRRGIGYAIQANRP